jgi:hypothetical protein
MTNKDNAIEIKTIFNNNELADLKKSLIRRHCLNDWNISLIYLFHITQTAGILTTSIATSYNLSNYIWLGVGLNLFASLLNVFQKTNQGLSKKLLANIMAIKNGVFIDEVDLADPDKSSKTDASANN